MITWPIFIAFFLAVTAVYFQIKREDHFDEQNNGDAPENDLSDDSSDENQLNK